MTHKCWFCKKKLGVKKYIIKIYKDEILVCSECEYVYKFLKKQVASERLIVNNKIIKTIRYGSKHCSLCKHFNIRHIDACDRDLYTYADKGGRPTYAQMGCGSYREAT